MRLLFILAIIAIIGALIALVWRKHNVSFWIGERCINAGWTIDRDMKNKLTFIFKMTTDERFCDIPDDEHYGHMGVFSYYLILRFSKLPWFYRGWVCETCSEEQDG